MNRLRELRITAGLKQTQVASKLRKQEPRIDAAMISRYESGVCLPTVPQLEQIEAILGMDRMEIYEPEDLDLMGVGHLLHKRRRKDRRSEKSFRKCFRLSRQLEKQLPEDLIETLGFASWQSWFECEIHRMLRQYEQCKANTTMHWIKQRVMAGRQQATDTTFAMEKVVETVPDWLKKPDNLAAYLLGKFPEKDDENDV